MVKSTGSYLNRFLSADTIVPDPTNPQSFNRYSYVNNNPVNFNDPSGHRDCEFDDNCGPPPKDTYYAAIPIDNVVFEHEEWVWGLFWEERLAECDDLCTTSHNFSLSAEQSRAFEYILHHNGMPDEFVDDFWQTAFNEGLALGLEKAAAASLPGIENLWEWYEMMEKWAYNDLYDAVFEINTAQMMANDMQFQGLTITIVDNVMIDGSGWDGPQLWHGQYVTVAGADGTNAQTFVFNDRYGLLEVLLTLTGNN